MCHRKRKTASHFRYLHGYISLAIFRKAPPNSTPYRFREKEVRSRSRYESASPRRDAPELCFDFHPQETRGRREDRVRAAPAVSRAIVIGKKRTRAYRFSGGNPAFPAQWFTAYSALAPVTGLSCHRHPLEVLLPANLTPASGRQAHTASPSARVTLVSRNSRVHRIPPRVRDDRDPPLSSGETGEAKSLICPTG
jgi:hypothetical protein